MRAPRLLARAASAAAVTAAVAFAALLARNPARPVHARWPVMGTVAQLSARGPARARLDTVRDAVRRVFARLDGLLSAWDESSELSRLTRAWCGAAAEPPDLATFPLARVAPEVLPCYRFAFDLAALSGGAFNPRVGARLRDLGFSRGQPFCALDFGAVAKGFAVDRAWETLRADGPADADLLIDLGGNLRVLGGAWRTGVRNPFGAGFAAVVTLTNGEAVATSGNYERFIERDGLRLSHILDGRTGRPVSGTAGVTVVAPSAMLADGLSTTLFILGPDAGAALLSARFPAADALWLPDTPAAPRILATPRLAARLAAPRWPVTVLGSPSPATPAPPTRSRTSP